MTTRTDACPGANRSVVCSFITDTGAATASDIAASIDLVRDKVELSAGITLMPEVRRVEEFQ